MSYRNLYLQCEYYLVRTKLKCGVRLRIIQSTQYRSFRRRSSKPVSWLVRKQNTQPPQPITWPIVTQNWT